MIYFISFFIIVEILNFFPNFWKNFYDLRVKIDIFYIIFILSAVFWLNFFWVILFLIWTKLAQVYTLRLSDSVVSIIFLLYALEEVL